MKRIYFKLLLIFYPAKLHMNCWFVGKEGGCNLLIATDVAQEGLDMPKCNFVIRYNFVSNEIGSVQSKGRARAPNSECYLIVNRNSINEKKEYENLEKEHMMLQALKDIDEVSEKELEEAIRKEQVSNLPVLTGNLVYAPVCTDHTVRATA